MLKNVASQKFRVFAFDSATGLPKSGDAANLTAYVSKDYGAVTVLADTSATEEDATNAKGYYLFDAAQAETNADVLMVSGKSSTSGVVVVGAPATVHTFPATGILAPATAGRTLVVDSSGLADANVVKLGPTGSGTAQTARDLGASVLLAASQHVIVDSGTVTTVTNQLTAAQVATGVWTDTTAGDFTTALSVGKSLMNGVSLGTGLTVARCTLTDTVTTYTGNTLQTGDSYVVVNSGTFGNAAIKGYVDDIGVAGAGLTALGDTRLANLDATVSSRGTSTLTQTQVTGGAYTVQSASCVLGDARIANLDAAVSSRTKPADTQAAVTLVTTTTNLTNAPPDSSGVTSLLARLGAFTGTGVNTVLGFFKALLSKTATLPSDVGGTFDPATDSTEAIRDRGDAAWVTATGFALAASAPSWYTAPVDVSANVLLIKTSTDHLATAMVLNAGAYRFTAAALALAPTGTGGGGGGDCPTAVEIREEMDDNSTQLAAIRGKLDSVGLTIIVQQTVPSDGGAISIRRGDDYLASEGRELSWNSDSTYDLAAATLTLVLYNAIARSSGEDLAVTATATGVSGAWTIKAPLTAAQSAGLAAGRPRRLYEMRVEFANEHEFALWEGAATVS